MAPKIKTADERIEAAKVATKRVEDAFVEMVVAMEQLRVVIISLSESPVMIELAESVANAGEVLDDEINSRPGWWRDPE